MMHLYLHLDARSAMTDKLVCTYHSHIILHGGNDIVADLARSMIIEPAMRTPSICLAMENRSCVLENFQFF